MDTHDSAEEILSFGKIYYKHFEVGLVTNQYANEGRFFSGVSPDWKDKVNCEIRLLSVQDVPRAFIYAVKDVKPFEVFYVYYGTEYDKVASSF